MFKFDVNITEQDYNKFILFHSVESKYAKRAIRFARIWAFIAFLIMSAIVILNNREVGWGLLLAVIPIAVILFLLSLLIKPFNKLGNRLKGRKYYSPVSTVEFNDDYISETTPETKLRFKYPAMDSAYVVSNDVVYIYRNYRQAFIIPRASFESQEQWDSFMEFIKGKIKDVSVIE